MRQEKENRFQFRAWHKTWSNQWSEYITPDTHKPMKNGMQYVDGMWWGNSGVGHVRLGDWSGDCLMKEVEIMQFTGLKKGKKIFEGDILRQADGHILQVVYQAPSFVLKEKPESKTWFEGFILKPQERQFEEIIGNIYENPELLK